MKRRICVVVTARPSYARIKSALAAIQAHPRLELQLVVAASALLDRYGSTIDVIRADGFEPDARVYMLVEGENLVTGVKSTGMGIMELATIFDNLQPDAVLSIADRYETIATAIAGSYMNIPVVHVQGGEVTGSIDEKVRHAVTKLADLHFVSNEQAARRVLGMGEYPERIHVTGCPSIDLAAQIVQSNRIVDPVYLQRGVGASLPSERPYMIVMQHPVTYEWDHAEAQIAATLTAVSAVGLPTYWFWPNVDAGSDGASRAIRRFREYHADKIIRFLKNMPPEEFLSLLRQASCLVGNSSTGIRESAYLGTPVVNIGSRQAGRDRGRNVIDASYDAAEIEGAIRSQLAHGPYGRDHIYGDGKAGQRMADLLATTEFSIEKRITL